jgi:cardiolipin synthase
MQPDVAASANLPAGEVDVLRPIREQVAGHELTLFTESPPLIASMVRDIESARRRVWLEIYIFLDDPAGQAIAEALKERARAGLDVRILYDAIGSQTTPAAFFHDMEEAGVQVHCFHSLWEAFARFSPLRILNRRNHRKLLVVDDGVAYFGGMNIIDHAHAAPVQEADQLPLSAGWRDVHVRLRGPQQHEVADSFLRSWRLAHNHKVRARPRAERLALLDGGSESIHFFDLGPGPSRTRAARVFMRLLRSAERSVTLSMAYFLPVAGVLRELFDARRRGVRVRLVVPGESDVPLVQHATRFLYRRLLRRRFQIYERLGHMLHSKVLVVDDQWTVLGSCNLDARSLWINLEFVAVVHSPRLARTVNAVIQHEVERSRRITLREWRSLSWRQRLLDRMAWWFRWWL